ncbi:Fic family protein [Pyxidicoccus sp. 3LFB2]
MYIWEATDWPKFSWEPAEVLEPLATARHRQGLLLGRMLSLGFELRQEARLQAVTEEVVRSSEIEGEHLERASVRSSVARRLGLPEGVSAPRDQKTEGVVAMMLDATSRFAQPLTSERLMGWHAAMFPTGHSGLLRITTGGWRDDAAGPMQVVSGPLGRERVHYQAPPAERLDAEMGRFLTWFNAPYRGNGLVRAALAHLWFVTIHPFDDGNGRIARAITDMALAQLEHSEQRFYSVSSQILRERSAYYDQLERSQKGTLDVTSWLVWFLECYSRAIDAAEATCADVLKRAAFWHRHPREPFNPRQRSVLSRLLDAFEGKLTAKKWAALAKCSVDTAQRDLNDLVTRGILVKNPGGGKNTSYTLVVDETAT